MGLFDSFYDKKKCPKCGAEIQEWQTKELGKAMRYIGIGGSLYGPLIINDGKVHVYALCECQKMITGWAIFENGKFVGVEISEC